MHDNNMQCYIYDSTINNNNNNFSVIVIFLWLFVVFHYNYDYFFPHFPLFPLSSVAAASVSCQQAVNQLSIISADQPMWRILCCAKDCGSKEPKKNMLGCMMQNPSRCSRTCWYFWHTALALLCTGTYYIFFWPTIRDVNE